MPARISSSRVQGRATVLVSYRRGPMTLGIKLVRGYPGSDDDYVALFGVVDGAEGEVEIFTKEF
jgi:hypothetical protein